MSDKTDVTVAIIEDELPAARLLESTILTLRPHWKVEYVGASNEEAEEWFNSLKKQPDIIFSDIELSDGISLDFFEKARPESMVVFVTAYDEYALRAFKVDSIDYLLKPIEAHRVEEAIAKYERMSTTYIKTVSIQSNWGGVRENLHTGKRYRTRFLIERGEQYESLNVDKIAYFFSENKICYAQTFDEGNFILEFSLDRLSEELDPDVFFRTSRQTLVSIRAVEKIENYFQGKVSVYVNPPYKDNIVVSKEKSEKFRAWLDY